MTVQFYENNAEQFAQDTLDMVAKNLELCVLACRCS